MQIDKHSVVYFINEEYGVVFRVNGATQEVAIWDRAKKCFAKRLNLRMASFLARTDRYEGKWCAAHPTYSAVIAGKVAARMTATLPAADGMRLAKMAKATARQAELREKGAARMIREISENWKIREAKYAGM